jgi:aspartyl-tRNA(Asn)/glutamyl-tRNA(Gln) amidotransferase subunit A
MTEDDVCFLPATDLIDHYRRRRLSPVEVAEAVLRRIERLNPILNAFITVTPDLALQQAREAERAYATGEAVGALAGVPISIKDLTPTRGIRTSRGSLIDPEWTPDYDPPFVERVYAAGAIMLGKTNTPEYGWKGDSGNRLVGPTQNPWRPGRTAGGSSGGGAAAVAAGLGPLALGSDGAGSIRIPSSFCGIFGLKPSFGLVPQYPPSAVGDLSHLGPMTRTVRDAALLLTVTAGRDTRDRLSWSSGIDYLASINGKMQGLRIAWSPDLGYARVAPAVRQATKAAAARFEELGCSVEEVNPGLPDPWDILDPLWACGMAAIHQDNLEQVRDKLDPGRLAVIEHATRFSGIDFASAMHRREAYRDDLRRFMSKYDLLLTPTLPITAFTAGEDHPGEIGGIKTTYLNWTSFTYPFNISGQPAATVPCGFDDDGLPIGLQIIGRWHDDASVLRAAAALEAIAPWAARRPDEAMVYAALDD